MKKNLLISTVALFFLQSCAQNQTTKKVKNIQKTNAKMELSEEE